MPIKKETKLYFRTMVQQKKIERLQNNLRLGPILRAKVAPASVYDVNDIRENVHPSLHVFAKTHGYNYVTLLRHLRRENILTKECGTWILHPDLKDQHLVFYTIGRQNCYSQLDMYLLPDGVTFMEQFIAEHPIKHRVKRNKELNQ